MWSIYPSQGISQQQSFVRGTSLYTLPYNVNTVLKVGSEHDANPRHKHDAEIEIDSIHTFRRCVTHASWPHARLRHNIVNRPLVYMSDQMLHVYSLTTLAMTKLYLLA